MIAYEPCSRLDCVNDHDRDQAARQGQSQGAAQAQSPAPRGDDDPVSWDVAEALFARDGLHGVTLKAVAKESGVDTALLHYYFDDKNRLFSTVLPVAAPRW